jgi:hypothetical protein
MHWLEQILEDTWEDFWLVGMITHKTFSREKESPAPLCILRIPAPLRGEEEGAVRGEERRREGFWGCMVAEEAIA